MMKNAKYQNIKKYLIFTFKDLFIMLATLGIASTICILLQSVVSNDTHVPLIFVLAVLIISLMTNGYLFGIISSVISVLLVNWAFTFPYRAIDFSIYGYPITFLTMLAVSIVTSSLITRYKQQGEALRQSEAEKMRANFLRSISHDLRTPLAIIIGDSEMVLANEDKKENKYLLTDIKENAEWLVRLVENILSITKINGDVGKIAKSDEVPEEVLSSSIELFKKKNPNVEFETHFPEELFFIPMDYILIQQVFINLFENAVDHGKCSKIIISLHKEKDKAVFDVQDNGVGIEYEHLMHLFDATFQSQDSQSIDSNKFMGIGLAVCKTIIQAHGGSIQAENTNIGAKFSFSLALK